MNKLPEKLIELRKHYKYSQEYLANYLGIAVFDYVDVENGTKILSYSLLSKLADLYQIDTAKLFLNTEEIVLDETEKKSVDEDNIKYFTKKPKNFKAFLAYLKKHYIVTTVVASLVVAVIILTSIVIVNKSSVNLEINLSSLNNLSVNDYDVLYIDSKNGIKGSGDNTDKQLINLPTSNIVSVKQGNDFAVYLDKDGKVTTSKEDYKEEVEKLSNIVEIGCGNNFIVALDKKGSLHYIGEDKDLKSQVEKLSLVTKMFVSDKAVLTIDKNDELTIAGTLLGSSVFKDKVNIIDVDTSDNLTAILYDDGTVAYKEINNKTYQSISTWQNIVDVCCGDSFIAGLKEDGSVVIASLNDKVSQANVTDWSNIVAIDAGSNYLIGLTKDYKVKGVGENKYKQFEQEALESLESISSEDVTVSKSREDSNYKLSISFKENKDAIKYKVELECDNGVVLSEELTDPKVEFLIDANVSSFNLNITCLGDNATYQDSEVTTIEYKMSEIYCENCEIKTLQKLNSISSNNIYFFKSNLDDGRTKLEVYLVDEEGKASNYKYELELDNGTKETHYAKENSYTFIFNPSGATKFNVSITCVGDNSSYSNSDITVISDQSLSDINCYKCDLSVTSYELKYNFTNLNLKLAQHIFDYYKINYSLDGTCNLDDSSLKILNIEGIENNKTYTEEELSNLKVTVSKCGK